MDAVRELLLRGGGHVRRHADARCSHGGVRDRAVDVYEHHDARRPGACTFIPPPQSQFLHLATYSILPQVLVTPQERLSHGMSLVDRRCPPPHNCAGKAARQHGQIAPLVRVLLGIDAAKFNSAFAAHMARLPSE